MNVDLKWYQKSLGIIVLLVFFFPLGLYFMWKNQMWSKKNRWVITVVILLSFIGYQFNGLSFISFHYEPQNTEEFKDWVSGEWTGKQTDVQSELRGEDPNIYWDKYVFKSDGTYELFSVLLRGKFSGNSNLTNNANKKIEEENENKLWEIMGNDFNGKWRVGKDKFSDSGEEYYYVFLEQNGKYDIEYSNLYPDKKLVLMDGELINNGGTIDQFNLVKGDNSPF